MPVVTPDLGGDSPVPPQKTPSTESNFRQLDDAFLQTQAIIWLGEVLKIRFDEEISISDLLANGELLFEVSEAISKMLPTLSMDDTQLRVYEWKSLASNKSTRRYMPYYNVDSFLRMCKNLGMDGIDLFTPSDVVERRNTRKVCMCLRSLSKKAKLRDLNVPDFDSVTCTLAMPTDKVEYIRKSLEMSQSSSSLSIEPEVEKVSRRVSNAASALSNRDSDDCDEAESRFVIDESYESSDYPNNARSPNILGSQAVKNEDDYQSEYLSPSNAESVGSPCSQYYSDEDLSLASSDCQGSRVSGKAPELNGETRDFNHASIDWGDSYLDVGKYKDLHGDDDEVANVSHDNEDTDTAYCNCLHPTVNDMCNGCFETLNDLSKVDFHGGETQKLSFEESFVCEVGPEVGEYHPNGKSSAKDFSSELLKQSSNVSEPFENLLDKSENHAFKGCTEVVDVGRESCPERILDGNARVEDARGKLEFYEEQAPCSMNDYAQNCICSDCLAVSSNGNDNPWDPVRIGDQSRTSVPLLLEVDSIICGDIPNNDKDAFGVNMVSLNHLKQHSDGNVINLLDIPCTNLNSSPDVVLAKNTMKCSKDCDDDMEASNAHNALLESVNDKPMNTDNIILLDGFATSSCDHQLEVKSPKKVDDTSHKNHQCVKEVHKGQAGVPKQEGTDKELPLSKPQRKLLKSVVKGAALLGLAAFLVHLRNNRRESHSDTKKQSTRLVKHVLECIHGQVYLETGAHLVRDIMYRVAATCSSKLVRDAMY